MRRSIIVGALLLGIPASVWPPPARSQPKCEGSAKTLNLRSIAAAVGAEPVWMTGGSLGCWCGERLQKTAWIVARNSGKTLEVHGSELNGDAAVHFPRDPRNNRDVSFVVKDIEESSVMPGGIDEDEWKRYAFLMGYVSYPRAGCYRLVATLGESVVDMVVDQQRCADCKLAPSQP